VVRCAPPTAVTTTPIPAQWVETRVDDNVRHRRCALRLMESPTCRATWVSNIGGERPVLPAKTSLFHRPHTHQALGEEGMPMWQDQISCPAKEPPDPDRITAHPAGRLK